MFRHILVPTEGSPRSEKAAGAAVQLAKSLGARLTGVQVVAETPELALERWAHRDPNFDRRFEKALEKRAVLSLEAFRDRARLEGVPCDCRIVRGADAAREILRIAEEEGCDLLFLASRGFGTADMFGTETLELLVASPFPVLLYR